MRIIRNICASKLSVEWKQEHSLKVGNFLKVVNLPLTCVKRKRGVRHALLFFVGAAYAVTLKSYLYIRPNEIWLHTAANISILYI